LALVRRIAAAAFSSVWADARKIPAFLQVGLIEKEKEGNGTYL
jgi:hypothetical protein